ncbi:MAG: P27 family phage terminase small subunit [Limnochordaceae bacterium]|nr:P27 family phage terminase small subunit [Limnochordaceae bacterium]
MRKDTTHIGPADAASVTMLAVAWHAVQLCLRDIAQHGAFTQSGQARQSVHILERFVALGLKAADALGLSPQARARLGLTTARATAAEELLLRLADTAPANLTASFGKDGDQA